MRNQSNTLNRTPTLHLNRVIRLGDKYNSQIFSFIIPTQLTRGFLQSVHSKQLNYGGHKWIIHMEYYTDTFDTTNMKEDLHLINYRKQHLGISIQLHDLSNGIMCTLHNIKFTIPHQENYTNNLVENMSDLNFTFTNNINKIPKWIEPGILINEHYTFDDATCLLEVEFQGAVTHYEEILRVPRDSKEASRCRSLETTTFSYAGADWSLILNWNSPNDKSRNHDKIDTRPTLLIQRHTSSKHWTQLTFEASLSWHDSGTFKIGPLDQLINPESGATTQPHPIGDMKLFGPNCSPSITTKHRIIIRIALISSIQISRVDLIPTQPQGGKNCARIEDPNGIDWIIMSDILGTFVRLKLFSPSDPKLQISHNENDSNSGNVRVTAWSVKLIPFEHSINVVKSMSSYYVNYTTLNFTQTINPTLQMGASCQEVVLPLDVEKVCSSNFGYSRPSDNAITLCIEWIYSYILCRADYQNYDELIAIQRYNLIRDLTMKNLEIEHLLKGRLSQHYNKLECNEKVYHSEDNIKSDNRRVFHESSTPEKLVNKKYNIRDPLIRNQMNSSISSRNSRTSSPTLQPPNVNFVTPPVFINGSQNVQDNNNDTSLTNTWRRHSSCLEDVGSNQTRQRRRLPSPPSSQLLPPRNICGPNDIYVNPGSISSPRLSLRSNNLKFQD